MTVSIDDVVDVVRAAVARVVRAERIDDVPLDRPLYEIGLDSLRAIELGQELADRFPIDPMTAFDRGATVGMLADEVLRLLPVDDVGTSGGVSRSAAGPDGRAAFDGAGTVAPADRVLRPEVAWDDIRLAVDDRVPHAMLLLFLYAQRLDPREVAAELQAGLNRFPHLSGRIVEDADGMRIAVAEEGVALEIREQADPERGDAWSTEPADRLRARFAPTAGRGGASGGQAPAGPTSATPARIVEQPLLAARLTQTGSGGCVLAYQISHRVLDGTGVALFLGACTAARRGTAGRPVVHDRSVLGGAAAGPRAELPPWYRPLPAGAPQRTAEWDLATEYRLATFCVTDETLRRQFGDLDRGDGWLTVTAMLIRRINEHAARIGEAGFAEAALWCDVRGTLGIPTNYTGNVGCYRHVPLTIARGEPGVAELVSRLSTVLTAEGRGRAAATYLACKQAEASGIRTVWTGREPHVLPVNLVPFAAELLDFGAGGPIAARMLTRNVHGLRISRSGRDDGFVVESCLPGALNDFIGGLS